MKLSSLLSIRVISGCILLLCFLAGFWHYLSYQEFIHTPIEIDEGQRLEVTQGQGASSLANKLESDGIIGSRFYFKLLVKLNPQLSVIKVGEYQLEKSDTPLSLLTKLNRGQVIQYSFTIVEGMNSFQVLEKLAQVSQIKRDWPEEGRLLAEKLALDNTSIEGWLYPDTYYFTLNSSGLALLRRASEQMKTILADEWQQRADNLPYKTPYEALIMASIIEKETGIASERDQIAGVFVRRLEKNMRLQTDPTVIYGIGADYDGDITYRHLRTLTPYNTYKIKGLPPTPIAMPGSLSIRAALNPADGDALYFVATGDGGHQFSATLEEHNRAVKQYLQKTRQRQN